MVFGELVLFQNSDRGSSNYSADTSRRQRRHRKVGGPGGNGLPLPPGNGFELSRATR